MPVLLDTNILLRLVQPQHPHARISEQALAVLRHRNEALHLTAQNLVEFWAVITGPLLKTGLDSPRHRPLWKFRH